jgi:RimJ/RimL family protein N-acetyltransferase
MIIGNKVYLRPIVREDLANLNRWRNDEDTFRYLGGGFMPVSIDLQERWLDSYIDTTGNDKRFIICVRENDEPIGMIGLYNIGWIHRVCEIGLFIGEKGARGKGYAAEACRLLEHFAFKYLNLRKIKLSVVADNQLALKLWKSLGYREIGEHVAKRFIDGAYRNVILMEKFAENSSGGVRLSSCLSCFDPFPAEGCWAA